MHKYVVYGNEEKTPLQVAEKNKLNLEECILCPDGRKEAIDCQKINSKLKIIGPSRECDLCKGMTSDLHEVQQRNSIAGDGKILICPYCYHSSMAVFYDAQHNNKHDIMRHINNMFNLFESRMKIKSPGV